MNRIKTYKIFLEENSDNKDSQEYLDSLGQKLKNKNKSNNPEEDEVDNLLYDTEEQKKKVIAKKDTIEKGLLNNIRDLEPDNQKEVQTQVQDYKKQVQEFDKTVKQIDNLNKTLKKSNNAKPTNFQNMRKARQQNNL